jgi:hypothetical protein
MKVPHRRHDVSQTSGSRCERSVARCRTGSSSGTRRDKRLTGGALAARRLRSPHDFAECGLTLVGGNSPSRYGFAGGVGLGCVCVMGRRAVLGVALWGGRGPDFGGAPVFGGVGAGPATSMSGICQRWAASGRQGLGCCQGVFAAPGAAEPRNFVIRRS